MEYLKPIEMLNQTIKRYHIGLLSLIILLGLSLIVVPEMTRNGNPLIVDTDAGAQVTHVSPWKLSVERINQFTKAYLTHRFEWAPETFSKEKSNLKVLVSDKVFAKLKESFVAFESLAQNQSAKSYYVLEDFGFANEKRIIEARVTRVLRIKDVALATPLSILINYDETSVTEANPFGLIVTAVKEVQLGSGSDGSR
jgi:hypothetical protein